MTTEHARSAAATKGRTMTHDNEEPSAASAGSATFTVDDVALLYDEWKRRYCGPRDMMTLVRRPTWKRVLSVPWMWWSHFGLACQYTGVFQAARLATLFVWAFLTTRK